MSLSPILPGLTAGSDATPAPKADPAKVRDAAKQFESLLIGQMLRQVREASSLEPGDQSATAILEMAEQQFAQVMAANGGMGLAKLIVQGMTPKDSQ
jgi:Rod binding domain-containing protein